MKTHGRNKDVLFIQNGLCTIIIQQTSGSVPPIAFKDGYNQYHAFIVGDVIR